MPSLRSRMGTEGEEPKEMSSVLQQSVEEPESEEVESPEVPAGRIGRTDAHHSIRGSATHAPYNRHESRGRSDRCVWCGRYDSSTSSRDSHPTRSPRSRRTPTEAG